MSGRRSSALLFLPIVLATACADDVLLGLESDGDTSAGTGPVGTANAVTTTDLPSLTEATTQSADEADIESTDDATADSNAGEETGSDDEGPSEDDVVDCTPADGERALVVSQSQVDELGGCTQLLSGLSIASDPEGFDPIVSLAALSELREISGVLAIQGNRDLNSLTGLEQLKSEVPRVQIQDNLRLENLTGLQRIRTRWLDIRQNASLESLDGLDALEDVNDVNIVDNPQLEDLSGLEGVHIKGLLEIRQNIKLQDARGVSGLRGEMRNVTIAYNQSLQQLPDWPEITELSEQLVILDNPSLARAPKFTGLRRVGWLKFAEQRILGGALSLPKLESVHRLEIKGNPRLASLRVPSLRTMIGSLEIETNDALATLEFSTRFSIGGDFRLKNNPALQRAEFLLAESEDGPPSIYVSDNAQLESLGLSGLSLVWGLYIGDNPRLSRIDLGELERSYGHVELRGNAGGEAMGLAHLVQVGEDLRLLPGPLAAALLELPKLSIVGDQLLLSGSSTVTRLSLPALDQLGRLLTVGDSPKLVEIAAPALREVVMIELSDVPALERFELPALAVDRMTEVSVHTCGSLTGLRVPVEQLERLEVSASLVALPEALPTLKRVTGKGQFTDNPSMTDAEARSFFDSLEQAPDDLRISGNG